jgi:hypothetical protein
MNFLPRQHSHEPQAPGKPASAVAAAPRFVLRLAVMFSAVSLPVMVCVAPVYAAEPAVNAAQAATALRARYDALGSRIENKELGLPVHLDSVESAGSLVGDIHARVGYPFAVVSRSLADPAHWCDILSLHQNTKFCRVTATAAATRLDVHVGTKHEQSLDDSYPVQFDYRVMASSPDYFQVRLLADEGPLSTRDYVIALEAIDLGHDQTFVHLRYAYAYGYAGRIALKVYLATVGSSKAGFTRVGSDSKGRPRYVGGVRGLVERNTLRYYLGIDAFLATRSAPAARRRTQRQDVWFSATERYARQLHEVDRDDYMRMKDAEFVRQNAVR